MLLHSHRSFCNNLTRLRLAVVFLLKAKVGDCISWLAIKCSSFTAVNRGTSKRSASNSVGDTSMPSVYQSNAMLERTTQFCLILFACFYVNENCVYPYILQFGKERCLFPRTILLLMVSAANFGVWILEQPGNSVLEFYPAFIHFIKCHYDYFGNTAAQTLAPCLYNILYQTCICGHMFPHVYDCFQMVPIAIACSGSPGRLVDVHVRRCHAEASICVEQQSGHQKVGCGMEEDDG